MIGSTIVTSHADGLDKLAKQARSVLVFLAVVQLVFAAILWMDHNPDMLTLKTAAGVGLVFAVLAFWARRQPLPAVFTGLGIYLVGIALAAFVDPATLYSGLAGKAVVAVLFYNGIDTALAHDKMQRDQASAGLLRRPQ